LEWLSSRGADVPVEVPFMILKDPRADINAPGVKKPFSLYHVFIG